jgi:hypothetical protein
MTLRRLRLLIVLLILGAIVNVAVAWGCAIWLGRLASVWIDAPDTPATPAFVQRLVDDRNREHDWSGWEARSGYRAVGFNIYVLRIGGTKDHHLQTTALVVGWPSLSLWAAHSYYIENEPIAPTFIETYSGILMTGSGANGWWIPGLPIWPGFAINTIFYAAILWMLLLGPGTIKRAIRRKRGLCPACGYPIGASPVCTECGKQLA